MTLTLLNLLHLADPTLPVGSYGFSHGLEGLVQEGFVTSAADVEAVIRAVLTQGLARCDLVALLAAHRLAVVQDDAGLAQLDGLLAAMTPIAEWRAANTRLARRLLATVALLARNPVLDAYQAAVEDGACHGHYCLAFAVAGAALEIEARETALAYTYDEVTTRLSAAVRLLPLGQNAAQIMLHRLKPEMNEAVGLAAMRRVQDMAPSLPALEIAGMAHAFAAARLFAS